MEDTTFSHSLRGVITHSAVSLFNALKVLGTHCPALAAKMARGHGIPFSPMAPPARNVGIAKSMAGQKSCTALTNCHMWSMRR